MTTRTQEEILARFRAIAPEDFFGFRQQVLLGSMTRETAQAALDDADLTGEAWEVASDVERAARKYLDFAIGKIVGHRGISAHRSVEKLTEYAWLLGRDDVVKAMESEPYAQYGAPQVKAFADGMGWEWPGAVSEADAAALARMADGKPCDPAGCEAGCGR